MNRRKRELMKREPVVEDFYSPFRTLKAMNDIMDEFWGRGVFRPFEKFNTLGPAVRERSYLPRTNFRDKGESYEIIAEMPGISKEDIDIHLKDGVLAIQAEKKIEKKEGEDDYYYQEISTRSYRRTFSIPENIKVEEIDASMNDGILLVKLPKMTKEEPEEHKIEVK